jgi:hypothetical protein
MESPWALPSITANRSPIVLHANQRPALCGAFCLVVCDGLRHCAANPSYAELETDMEGQGMPNYRRAYVPGASWFFTVNLLQRRNNDLLARHVQKVYAGHDEEIIESDPITLYPITLC